MIRICHTSFIFFYSSPRPLQGRLPSLPDRPPCLRPLRARLEDAPEEHQRRHCKGFGFQFSLVKNGEMMGWVVFKGLSHVRQKMRVGLQAEDPHRRRARSGGARVEVKKNQLFPSQKYSFGKVILVKQLI